MHLHEKKWIPIFILYDDDDPLTTEKQEEEKVKQFVPGKVENYPLIQMNFAIGLCGISDSAFTCFHFKVRLILSFHSLFDS